VGNKRGKLESVLGNVHASRTRKTVDKGVGCTTLVMYSGGGGGGMASESPHVIASTHILSMFLALF